MRGGQFFAWAAAVAGLFVASSALANPITFSASDIGKTYIVDYVDPAGGASPGGLSATAMFTLTGITDLRYELVGIDFTAFDFNYVVTNTSDIIKNSIVSGMAFNISPDLLLAGNTFSDGILREFSNTDVYSSYPNGGPSFDVCFASIEKCADSNQGLSTGASDISSIRIGLYNHVPSITIDDFFVRFQSISSGGNLTSTTGIGTVRSSDVPAPSMLVLFGLAVLALGVSRHLPFAARKRRWAFA
ncbi:MAG: cistern family PEP-CTERM protein [Novosphingobium sp.]